MIQFDSRYFNNAHRISDVKLAATVTELYDGQWLMLGENGEMVISDGTAKSYITLSSKYGNPVDNIARPITEGPAGRDNVSSTGRVTVLIGPFRLATDQYEVGAYAAGDALVVSANGKLQKYDSATNTADQIVANVWTAPASAGAPMAIVHE
jgi:hypothetical protein